MLVLRSIGVVAVTAAVFGGGARPAGGEETAKPVEASAAGAGKLKTRPPASPEAVRAAKEGVDAMKRRDWKRAAAAWQESVKLDPANAGAWANLGKVQLQQREAAAAIASLEKAVVLQPALAEAWMALGMAYDRESATMRAISCLTRAVHENPTDARTRNSLAIVMKKAGWPGAAESELQKALDLDPRYAEAHFNLAVMYLERRPPLVEMARRHYESARQLGAEPDKEMEAQLAGGEPAVEETPPATKLPASKSEPKPTRPKS
jgi:Flp pilus assembly protein TadD